MKLYIYDHCPFCVRARMIFGLRGVAVEQVVLANDDEANPIRMIGAKQVPILEKDDGSFMGESLDIVRYVDELAGKGRLKEEVRPEVQAWLDKVGEYVNKLVQPRMVKIGLPEFAEASAVRYFTEKKEQNIGNFEQNLADTPQYLAQIHADLQALEVYAAGGDAGFGGETGMEDILLFPVLRNLTIVKGIEWPAQTAAYVARMSRASGVNLYMERAI
ncbi:glutaredoxin 2 [Bergeriella denitrificans]|uniref:Glutaredoxin n=1 Tax=Bergeriella denitrificans TaxID=494 RepID=A0A378UGC9_BERDE|nr:glutaredoxin 2 [Bergeriella denitrificans]STZ75502.1 glutaredoxin [Bergeriella denitrificans]